MRKKKNIHQKVDLSTLIDKKTRIHIPHMSRNAKIGVAMAATIICTTLLAYASTPVFAASQYIEVTGDTVNVRSNAGTTYSVLGVAKKGSQYAYLSEKKDTKGQTWYYIQFSSGAKGWITAKYAKSVAGTSSKATTEASVTKVQITGATVNVRTGNSKLYPTLGVAKNGATYDYLGSSKASKGDVWYKIKFSSNKTGWVTSKYSKLITISSATTTTTAKTTTTTTVKTTAATETTAKTTATTTQTTAKTTATTTQTTAKTTTTAKSTAKTTTTTKAATTTTQNSVTLQYVRITGASANVRSQPGSSYTKLGTVSKGGVYKYLGSGKAANGVVWYKIQYTSSKLGWVASSYAQIVDVPNNNSTVSAQEAVNTAAKKYGAVGVQVAVIKNGKVSKTYNYGYATKKTVPMTDDSKIRIASVSKVVVGMNAVKMQEEGIVDLDANIGTYWGVSPYKKTTLRQLLTHTSYLKDNAYVSTKSGTANQLKSSACYRSSNAWLYNNYGLGMAGSTLEVASGKTLNSYANEKFFTPLGIDATFTSGNLKDTSKLATLYYPSDSVARSVSSAKSYKARSVGGNTAYFAGGLTISAKDMAKLTAILANDGMYDGKRYLSAESVKTMETQYCNAYARGHSFKQCIPLRYQTNIYGQDKLYYHLGTAYGTLSFMGYNPDTKNGVVVISTGASGTYDSYGTFNICADIANYFLNE